MASNPARATSRADSPSYAPGRTAMPGPSTSARSRWGLLSGTGAPFGRPRPDQTVEHVVGAAGHGEVVVKPPNRVVVQSRPPVGARILDEHDAVIEIAGIADRALDAATGDDTRHDQGLRPQLAQ